MDNQTENIITRIDLSAILTKRPDIEKIKQDYIHSALERLLKQENSHSIDRNRILYFCKLYIDKKIKFYPTIDLKQVLYLTQQSTT